MSKRQRNWSNTVSPCVTIIRTYSWNVIQIQSNRWTYLKQRKCEREKCGRVADGIYIIQCPYYCRLCNFVRNCWRCSDMKSYAIWLVDRSTFDNPSFWPIWRPQSKHTHIMIAINRSLLSLVSSTKVSIIIHSKHMLISRNEIEMLISGTLWAAATVYDTASDNCSEWQLACVAIILCAVARSWISNKSIEPCRTSEPHESSPRFRFCVHTKIH